MDPKASERGRSTPPVVERNIRKLLQHREEELGSRTRPERIADTIGHFIGSMRFVCLQLAIVSLWVAINLGWVPPIQPFDPTFVVLAVVVSVEALFLSTFVLITQNRMAALANKRADLDLQVSLLAEYEITRLLTLVMAMAVQMGLEVAQDPELEELSQDVAPEQVMKKMEAHQRAVGDVRSQ